MNQSCEYWRAGEFSNSNVGSSVSSHARDFGLVLHVAQVGGKSETLVWGL